MRRGLEWYRREPVAFLGGVQGLTSKEIAVYTIVLDLIYQHGGEINNDARWIAGWIDDMGPAAVRNTIESLVDKGKIFIQDDTKISQKRAENEVKTQNERRKTKSVSGRLGGVQSGISRSESSKNNDLNEATASQSGEQIREDKIREDNPLTPFDGKRFGNPVLALQAAVDPMTAKRFADHCEQKRKRLSVEGAGAIAQELLRYRAEGGNPVEAIELAIRRGWATIELEWLRRHNSETKSSGMSYEIPGKLSAENEAKLRTWPAEKWKKAIEIARDSGQWNPLFGPKPGEPGCLVPPEFLGELEQGGTA